MGDRTPETEDLLPIRMDSPHASFHAVQLFAAQDARQWPLVHGPLRTVRPRKFKCVGEFGKAPAAFVRTGITEQIQRRMVETQQLSVEIGNYHGLADVFNNRL